jgi:quercetin dioxygenase-like cupin family protein
MPFAIIPSREAGTVIIEARRSFQHSRVSGYHRATQQRGKPMSANTPFLKDAERLGPLASRYVEVESLPWKPTPCAGIDMKILLEDPESGLLTALFRWQPGAELALHEHVEIEQTFVLEGSLVDDEGEVRAGNYVWRPKGNRHIARSPKGALVLSMFLKPNIFLAGDAVGRDLR